MIDPTEEGRRTAAAPGAPTTPRPRLSTRRRTSRLGALLTATALGVGMVAAAPVAPSALAASPGFCTDGTQPYVPVSEARAWVGGESVTGLSVSKGTTPEGFTGSYIGFIDDALGKDKDLLLFRLSNPTIDGTNGLKPAGIWAGMSGSPVYASDGRLIGAVAYSLNYDNLPIAGVTPAEYMKNIGNTGLEQVARVPLTKGNLKTTTAGAKVAGASLNGSALTPVKTVNVAGPAGTKQNAFANRTLARTPKTASAAELLRSRTFQPAAAQSTSGVTEPLVAGGNIAVTLTSGDLVVGSIGTVTAICGNTVWAFGHPMTLGGKVSLLMSNASAAMVVPDGTGWVGSYKEVSEIGAPIGMINQDRNAGIRGTIGAVSSFPVTVNVQNPSGKQIASYATKVADQDNAAPAVATLTGQAAFEQLDQVGAGTGKVTWTISYRRANGATGTFTNSQIVSDRSYFPDEIGTPPAEDAWAITSQGFENATITGISVTLKLLSAEAVSYQVKQVQRLNKSKWSALDGSKLKPNTSYSLRNVYQKTSNGKPAGTVNGPAYTIKLSKSAKSKGTMKVSSLAAEQGCDPNGSCAEWGSVAESISEDFDMLVMLLDSQESNDRVLGKLNYKLKKGSSTRNFAWTGPGLMAGSTTAAFTIAKK